MQERHVNRKQYFDEQGVTVKKYVLPFIEETVQINTTTSVLEIGCGEGGNLIPFLDRGCQRIVGVDLAANKIENARTYFAEHEKGKNAEFIVADIYDIENIGQFDIIIARDVLEHIHDQERFMAIVKIFLKPTGKFFLGFPPWYNPFGGHQQICESKCLSKLPYFHILPRPLYRQILKWFKESPEKVKCLLEIKDTGITIERFERILKHNSYHKDKRTFYFINPNYEVKFGMKPRKSWNAIAAIPYLRNFLITTNYYVVSKI